MSRYYYKVMFEEDDNLGVAHAMEAPTIEYLPDEGKVVDWKPLLLELRDGGFPDYLANDLGYRMCSERLRRVFDEHASTSDILQWLDVTIKSANESRRYFVLHFPQAPDVLDKKKTIFSGEFVVKAVLSKSSIGGHQIFAYPNCGKLPLYISDEAKRAIDQERCTGMDIAMAAIA